MPGANAKKSVYFNKGEEYLKNWAESRPEGYSVYIKRLIIHDLEGDQENNVLKDVLKDYFGSQEYRDILINIVHTILDGKTFVRNIREPISDEEATDILGLITGI